MKLRLIQAGVGGMGKAWWTGATGKSPDFDLVAIVDIADEPLREAGEALKIPPERRFRSFQDAITTVPCDAILTVTPPAVHVEHAVAAFDRGLHVLTEKPIAHDLPSAQRMVAAARRASRQLLVAQNYRYSPVMQRMISLFREKPLGDFGHGHIDFYIPADFTGSFRETMEFPLLIDMAIHHIDLIRAVTGLNIGEIVARTFRPSWSWYRHHPGLKMLMQLDGRIPFSYSGDWSAHGKATSWNGTWRLQFAQGCIVCEDNQITIHRNERWNRNPTSEKLEIPELALTGQAALLSRFAEAIRTGTPAETSGEDNLHSFGAVMRAVESAGAAGCELPGAADRVL